MKTRKLSELRPGERFTFDASARAPDEPALLYEVIENNGDRSAVRCVDTNLPYPPIETVAGDTPVEHDTAFRKGQTVTTPQGRGIVIYVRMAGPDYTEPEAVSVLLDNRSNRPNYAGTIFPAEHVHPYPGVIR